MTEDRVQLYQYCEECSQIITPCLECGREESIEPFQVLLRNVFKDKFDDCHLCIIIRDRIKKQEQFSEHSIKTRNTECMVEVRCHTWLFDPSIRDPPNGLALVKRYSAFRQALGGDKLCIAFAVEIEFLQGALDISPVQLKIERYTSNDDHMRPFVYQASIPARPQYNVTQIRDWLDDCCLHHTECSDFSGRVAENKPMPTRILHIGAEHVSLKTDLLPHTNHPYATLSHVWGNDISHYYKLGNNNIRQLQKGIPILDLPNIYQEAIKLARILQLEYLWIDSMCILQDSKSDWEHEAPLMSLVYGNATCNLACTSPPKQFRQHVRGDPRSSLPCLIRQIPREHGLTDYLFVHAIDGVCPWTGTVQRGSWADISEWPLSSRAWTFQEHLISTRTLFFGQKRLFWDCCKGLYDEWLGLCEPSRAPKKQFYENLCVIPISLREPSLPDLYCFNNTWRDIVNRYRSRNLTVSRDRLVAFAGVARALHNITRLTYLAGIWCELWSTHLLWRRYNTSVETVPEEQTSHTVPSWSWFKVPLEPHIGIGFPDLWTTNDRKEWTTTPLATLVAFRFCGQAVNQLSVDSYTQFEGLELQLRTRILTTQVTYEPGHGPDHSWLRAFCYAIKDMDVFWITEAKKGFTFKKFEYWPDDRDTAFDELPSTLTLAPILQVKRHGIDYQCEISGLSLKYDSDLDAWSRIGFWEMCSEKSSESLNPSLDAWSRIRGWEICSNRAPGKHSPDRDWKGFADLEGYGEESLITLI